MSAELTIVIVAKDAATTVGRAIATARASGNWPILLVDDHSGDETIKTAKDAGGDRITIHKTDKSIGIGNARQTALDCIQTAFGMWLDADDEILPGRPVTMLESLRKGTDLAYDPAVLFNPYSEGAEQPLPIPDFVRAPDGILRSFERNWIPALTGGFNTAFARSVGYDRTFKCVEDYDFLLRAIAKGAHIDLLHDIGYRYAHTPTSMSRNIELTQAASKAALAKHNYSSIKKRIEDSGLPKPEQYLTLAHVASTLGHEDDWCSVVSELEKSSELIPPYNRSGTWLSAYLRATAALLSEDYALAADLLTPLAEDGNAADACNNLGVALWCLGKTDAAQVQWQRALAIMPNYMNASENLTSAHKTRGHITHTPLRQAPSRDRYQRD